MQVVEKEKKKYCPLLSIFSEGYLTSCEEENCAWWTGKSCAVIEIVRRLG
jgi:hypothetical protein